VASPHHRKFAVSLKNVILVAMKHALLVELDRPPLPIYSRERRFSERPRAQQFAAGDSPDSPSSGGRSGGGRTGNPRIRACRYTRCVFGCSSRRRHGGGGGAGVDFEDGGLPLRRCGSVGAPPRICRLALVCGSSESSGELPLRRSPRDGGSGG
jgi:hypothetical protein